MSDMKSATTVGRAKTRRKGVLRRLGRTILRSNSFQSTAALLVERWFRFTCASNPEMLGSDDLNAVVGDRWPVIIALWHGQQLLVPFLAPPEQDFACLFSRSADAEINARIVQRMGFTVVRGSGGRHQRSASAAKKGGVSATLALCNALNAGSSVVMIADISKGEPRRAGEGIVRLARLSGRPILPVAVATSRYHVIEKSWDKTTINLPFGKRCVRIGAPIEVAADGAQQTLDAAREAVTASLNRLTEEVYAAVEKSS
ncbi:lysophospholipid acyltransferase family protein [Pseudohoeflea coraliihabitans]|uniref:Lysophospholipid acyltransferase family protein n=1 Tax=Pseudohoeflea coraliihabitans TaxID=2860393 RepID=A0ABS6WMH3_9HYPH|nr:lysophospholipid acyltransferase family protein [Pseudohoeflea sp. DP4N28-3]MBW3097090.1 lysophospholipid acyltransferase family protein [Pseudohoeflea sp. DP4N28-3]